LGDGDRPGRPHPDQRDRRRRHLAPAHRPTAKRAHPPPLWRRRARPRDGATASDGLGLFE
jgi:hypothetical protein